jgi:hypothetical protein
MLLDHSSTSQTAGPITTTLTLVAGTAFFFLVALFGGCFALLRKKIQLLTVQADSKDTRSATLAAELDAQALVVRQMSLDLQELRKRLEDHNESIQSAAPLWASADMPVNLNRRGQILRLSRKGKSIPEIARDLNVAQGEVELLLKVHDLSQKSFEQDKPYTGKQI